jgi:DNA-directed RNA polymerase specialized sigma24 family protein
MSRDLLVVERRLQAWADWARKGGDLPGWPGRSSLQKGVEAARLGISLEHSRIPIEMPEPVAQVEKVVNRLPAEQREVVLIHYRYGEEPLEIRIRCANRIGVRGYQRQLERARWSVRLGLELLAEQAA